MNRLYIFLAFLTFSLAASSQKRLFKKALANGPQNNGYYYVIYNKGNRMLHVDDLQKYADKNGYILGDATYKNIIRFRKYAMSVETIEFMPKTSYVPYIYSNINYALSLPTSVNSCSAYVYSSSSNSLQLLNGLNWSGITINNKADGYGVLAADFNQYIMFIEGRFENGFPIGDLKISKYTTNGTYYKFRHSNLSKDMVISVGELHDGLAYIKSNGKYGFIDQNGNLVIKNEIDSIVSDFDEGRATVVKNNEEQIIDSNGDFLDYTQKQKEIFASDSYLDKACNYIGNYDDKAFYMLSNAYKYGNPRAAFWMGKLYAYRKDGKENYDEALKWYKMSERKDDIDALYELGNLYSNNRWSGYNEKTAFDYYMRGAKLGHHTCYIKVGLYYEKNHIYEFEMIGRDKAIKYIVKINTALKKIQLAENNKNLFLSDYYNFKEDVSGGRIGFSVERNRSVDMTAISNQYFIISYDGTINLRCSDNENYSMKAEDKSAFLITYEHLTNALNNRSVLPPTTLQGDDAVIDVVEIQPEFPGGVDALMKYLVKNIKYPSRAQESGIQGTVVVKFVVDKDGSITDIKIAKALDPECDKEAVRVIRGMPKWKPAMQLGKPVRCQFSVPVRFKLQ